MQSLKVFTSFVETKPLPRVFANGYADTNDFGFTDVDSNTVTMNGFEIYI
jgi:hypothetical protein